MTKCDLETKTDSSLSERGSKRPVQDQTVQQLNDGFSQASVICSQAPRSHLFQAQYPSSSGRWNPGMWHNNCHILFKVLQRRHNVRAGKHCTAVEMHWFQMKLAVSVWNMMGQNSSTLWYQHDGHRKNSVCQRKEQSNKTNKWLGAHYTKQGKLNKFLNSDVTDSPSPHNWHRTSVWRYVTWASWPKYELDLKPRIPLNASETFLDGDNLTSFRSNKVNVASKLEIWGQKTVIGNHQDFVWYHDC